MGWLCSGSPEGAKAERALSRHNMATHFELAIAANSNPTPTVRWSSSIPSRRPCSAAPWSWSECSQCR